MLKRATQKASFIAPLKTWLQNLIGQEGGWPGRLARRSSAVSFADLVGRRREWLFANLPRDAAEYHYNIHRKHAQKHLAERLGFKTAKLHLLKVPLAEAIRHAEGAGLERFVIKPNSSKSAIGCRCVVKEDEEYLDLLTGNRFANLQALHDDARREYAKLNRADEWLLEELLLPFDGSLSLIDDYKFYCIGGVVELIVHKKPLGKDRMFYSRTYTRNWTLVNVGLEDKDDAVVEAPLNGARLVETAEAVSSKLCYPFIRIDLYDASQGIYLGEFTPGPGRMRNFTPEWNERLCRKWLQAAKALEEGLRSGKIQPLAPEG